MKGTAFQLKIWNALLQIPSGGLTTYSDLAQKAGYEGAQRAVGTALGNNPVVLLIPCHRVIGADGSLTGYAGGIEKKRALLELEHAKI